MRHYRVYKVHWMRIGECERINYYSDDYTDADMRDIAKESVNNFEFNTVTVYKADPFIEGKYYPIYEYHLIEKREV